MDNPHSWDPYSLTIDSHETKLYCYTDKEHKAGQDQHPASVGPNEPLCAQDRAIEANKMAQNQRQEEDQNENISYECRKDVAINNVWSTCCLIGLCRGCSVVHFAFASSLASPADCEIDEVGEGGPEPEGGEEAGEGEEAEP